MATEHNSEAARIAKDLAEGFSAQARYSNKVWLALIVAATLVLFPDPDSSEKIKLPFSLGSADAGTYKVIGFFILTILMISYCQTYAAAHVAVRLAHDLIGKLEPKSKSIEARKLFDLHVTPVLSRVAPLAQLIIIFPKLAASYYCLLKLVAISVIFAIPSTALIVAFCQLSNSASVPSWIFLLSLLALCVTSVAVLQMLLVEFRHAIKVARMYWTGQLADNIGHSAHHNTHNR